MVLVVVVLKAKPVAMGLVERKGKVIAKVVPDVNPKLCYR